MVTPGDSCYEDHGFESWHRILDGHFSQIFVVKSDYVCLKKPKINEKKRPGLAHLKSTKILNNKESKRKSIKLTFILCNAC